MRIYWSKDDNVFVAEVPELPGCMAHGKTYEKAIKNIKTAVVRCVKFKLLQALTLRGLAALVTLVQILRSAVNESASTGDYRKFYFKE